MFNLRIAHWVSVGASGSINFIPSSSRLVMRHNKERAHPQETILYMHRTSANTSAPIPDRIPHRVSDGQLHADHTVKVLQPSSGWAPLRLPLLWRYRGLLYFLVWRDVKVRYKQTALGAAWAVIRPALTMLIFTVIFGNFAKIPSEGVPYAVFSYAALLPWSFFSTTVSQSSLSLVNNANLISKVYFPRLLLPLAATLAGLMDLAIAAVLLLVLMVVFHVAFTPFLLLIPVFTLLSVAATLAVGVWLSAVAVEYRDVAYVIPFLTQIWLYATPVAYPASFIHGRLSIVLALNPMSAVVEGFRWAVLGHSALTPLGFVLSIGVTAVGLITGLFYFRRAESRFADVV